MTGSLTGGPARRIDVCVCTFRRAQLVETIRSLAALELPPDVELGIVVADNDMTPSARERVAALAETVPHPIRYVHAPAGNISIARNACLDHCTGDFAAFIDDDETASPAWLAALLATAEETGVAAVLGPVRAHYDVAAPRWMRDGDFHSTAPVWVGGEIRTGYTCNVLLRLTSPALARRRFDLALGQSGGEDTDFFSRLHEAGGKIAFAPDAWVEEVVPASRASFAWLARRRFRMGQTHGRQLCRGRGMAGRVMQWALAGGKAGYCFAAAVPFVVMPARRNRHLLRGLLHVGAMSGLAGMREIRQYGQVLQGGASGHAA
ncbi:glycosyltransferase [Mesorhizobium xinjiangense]|uniref:glycosyltransferase n=1 Tax=Mesorhizobium xinjiangense TaxID=2678685 RepID=UPI0012EE655E|nr:glycosyltransferase family 2 protein [Mesorhizobium xinjiangense]